MAHVHVVFAHPGGRGFTRQVLDAFLRGLGGAGHTSTISDLYAMQWRAVLSAEEYARESAYDAQAPVPDDVAKEQAKLEAAEVWVFVYPVWWTDVPAILKGWFDRVWTVGFREKPRARHALVLCTAGYTVEQLEATGHHQAMRAVMLADRIAGRAEQAEFVLLGGSVAKGDEWSSLKQRHLTRAEELGRSI